MRFRRLLAALSVSVGLVACSPVSKAPPEAAAGNAERIALRGFLYPLNSVPVADALRSAPDGTQVVLDLDTPGGLVLVGLAILDAIDEARERGVTIVTEVRPGATCGSFCVVLFAAGDVRLAAPDARFIVHGARDLTTGHLSEPGTDLMIDQMARRGADRRRLEDARFYGVFDLPDREMTPEELAWLGIPLSITTPTEVAALEPAGE